MQNRISALAACIWIFTVSLVPSTAHAESIALVNVSASWKYFVATNAPPTNWNQITFDDNAWLFRPSGFSSGRTFGYLEATLWPPATNYNSVFLRKKFQVENVTNIHWLVLRLEYDDGFVAYLNGHEIVRRNLTNNPVIWNEAASFHPGGAAEDLDVSAFTTNLFNGENVLAIEVHNSTNALPTAPVSDSLRIVPEFLANITRGPYIQNVTTQSVQIIWQTPFPTDGAVEYGTDQTLGLETVDSALATNHVITVTNLSPGTQYNYRVRSSTTNHIVFSPLETFRTFRTSGAIKFHVVGDTGGEVVQQPSGIVPQYRFADLMAQSPADLILHNGDVVYPEFTPGRADTRFLSVYRTIMVTTPFFATMGNHEFDPMTHGGTYLDTFYLPTNSMTGTEHFYSFDDGDAHFVSLYVPLLNWGGDPPDCGCLPQYALTNGSPQYVWLTNDLATSTKPWKFLFFHVPIDGSGNHRYDDYNENNIDDRLDLQQILYPIAAQYGVQLIFNGHDHGYERLNPTNGVYSIVSGGGGGSLPQYFYSRSPGSIKRDPASCQFNLSWNYLDVSVSNNTLHVEAIGTNGLPFDSMTIRRTPPPAPVLHEASWNTPLIENFPANDGHGNISNQTFNLIGTPLLTAGGKFSNLGRVYVNNDATNLYVGFEQTMLREDNNFFLFVESPRTNGVSNLVGLGDGATGTTQGVEGFDILENLFFTNFTPCVGVLLGDEYGDGNDRLFSRSALALTNVGQGVFRLDTNFSAVDSARLQQFNRSPQQLEPAFQLIYPERDANFIEVSIPFSELGGLHPGDIVKLAAVAGGPSFDAALQLRQLDTAFLGASMTGSGLSNVVLSGINVRLALDPLADEDSDGLPNGWEEAHHLDPRSAAGDDGASGDPDNDGMTNLAEFMAGTDPFDAASVLRLSVENISPEYVRLSWSAILGKQYQLEVGEDPLLFTNHPSPFFPRTAISNSETFLDSFTNIFPASRFYRIRVAP